MTIEDGDGYEPVVVGTPIVGRPGLFVMSHSHTDEHGKIWPLGTTFRLHTAGFDRSKEFQRVVIQGQLIRFFWAENIR